LRIPFSMSLPAALCLAVYMLVMLMCLQSPTMWLFESLLLQRGQQSVEDSLNILALFMLWSVPVRYLRVVVCAPGGREWGCSRKVFEEIGSQCLLTSCQAV